MNINLNSNAAFDMIYGHHYGANINTEDYPCPLTEDEAELTEYNPSYQELFEDEPDYGSTNYTPWFNALYPTLATKVANGTIKYLGDIFYIKNFLGSSVTDSYECPF